MRASTVCSVCSAVLTIVDVSMNVLFGAGFWHTDSHVQSQPGAVLELWYLERQSGVIADHVTYFPLLGAAGVLPRVVVRALEIRTVEVRRCPHELSVSDA